MTDSNPPKAMPGVSLRVLNKVDGPVEGYETVIVEIQVPAGTPVGRHSHPGVESTYVIEGSGVNRTAHVVLSVGNLPDLDWSCA